MGNRCLTSDADGQVVACPECDCAGCVRRRSGARTHKRNPEDEYACDRCSATFDDPVERERHPAGHRNAKYAGLDPEDVGLPAMGER